MKKVLLVLLGLVTAVTLVSCGGGTPEVAVSKPGTPDAEKAAKLTSSLSGSVIWEYAYGDKYAPISDVKSVKEKVVAVIENKDFLELTKKGYSLYVVGHACKWGSAGANQSIGNERAKQVILELRGLGVESKYIKPYSFGDKEMDKAENSANPKQRRITFMVGDAKGMASYLKPAKAEKAAKPAKK